MFKYLAAGLLGLAVAGAASVGAAAPVTIVDEVVVVNDNNVILRVEVSGDLGPRTVVVGDAPGLNCGGRAFRFNVGEMRQCWAWVPRRTRIRLTAKGMRGAYGDWTVRWQGCEVVEGGAACLISPRSKETLVAAHFTGAPL